jgi:putative FmdB family regulatory protein
MPLYEYECKKCHHRFERIVKFSDKPMKKCPDCGGAVEQLISAPAVQFKGSGWYVTDYAKKSGAAASVGNSNGESSKSDSGDSDNSKDSGSTDSGSKEASAKDSTSKDSSSKDSSSKESSKESTKKPKAESSSKKSK